ncbi:hypothetical protein EW026_g6040 [Hermanssonia centrifuga]|uniref:Uncharacterized protein n=1 Tax=Hermanssonia centrifuga TaxID=98765 RepID=A0A4S4KC72_9APHY|nr:hypothetical protein EW026_g6040 [Hermanssonia centrifuga]
MDIPSLTASFSDAYKTLVKEEPLTCAKSGMLFPAAPSPGAVIIDVFADGMLYIVRKLSQKPVQVICWVSCSATAGYTLFGPAGHNQDGGSLRVRLEAEVVRTGKSLPEITGELFCSVKGDVIRVPGMPPMYDYESHPQETVIKGHMVGPFHLAAIELVNGCDGILVATPDCFEPTEVLDAFQAWFAETSRKVYTVGPMLPPPGENAASNEKKQSASSGEIDKFMEQTLKTHGKQSLIYISFGSVYWSMQPEKIWTFLDVLVEKNIPFILSHGSPFAKIPDPIKEKIKASGLGLLSPWSPQQTILAHPATGWTGKACTGTIEAVREEAQGILEKAFGEDGAKKRAKAVELQRAFEAVWAEGLSTE